VRLNLAKRSVIALVLGGLIFIYLAPGPAAAQDAPPPSGPLFVGPLATASWDSLNLARATYLWEQEDLRGAVHWLESIDVRESSAFARADRAAFLLGVAHLRLGDREAFLRVADTGNPANGSPYRQWLGYARLLVAGAPHTGADQPTRDYWNLPGTVVLTAAHLLESGRTDAAVQLLSDRKSGQEFAALHRYLKALAAPRADYDAVAAWRNFASTRPGQSVSTLPAAQVHAMLALATGDTVSAREILSQNVPDAVDGPQARRVIHIAGQLEAVQGDWATALGHFDTATESWDREAAWLEGLANPVQAAETWRIWTQEVPREGEIFLPALDWSAALNQAAAGAVDLTREPDFKRPDFHPTAPNETRPTRAILVHAQTHGPDKEQWLKWDRLVARKNQADSDFGKMAHALAELEAERGLRLQYLASGRQEAFDRTVRLGLILSELDELLARLDLALGDLDRTRDAALLLFAQRAAALAADLRTSLIYVQSVRHFHVEGPGAAAEKDWPAAIPRPAELLDLEEALANEILDFLALFGARVPELVNRSCREIWVPRLAADAPALRLAMAAQQRRGASLVAAMDSTALALPIDSKIAAAQARLTHQATVVDSLTQAQNQTKGEIIGQVMARGRIRMAGDREGLDYLRSNALYWVAVGDSPNPDDDDARSRARESRRRAQVSLRDYVEQYPEGRARAESRYRLADLELLQARDDFQLRMAGYLDESPAANDLNNQDLAPFVDYAPAITLYRRILADDPEFTHLPAVLFQLGMILGDAGDPESGGYLESLVTRYPDSPFNQEAWLRLGDQHFEIRDYAASRPWFAAAARGDDPSLRAIALYKLGWAHFEQDEFPDAADAFGRLLDHCVTDDVSTAIAENPRTETDLQNEAKEYLVHSLIRAGGATTFSTHFGRVGERSYEAEILMAMGHQFSGVSLYGEAIACDRLWLERFGDRDQAVAVAKRLVSGYQRWHKPDAARRTHLELAARFLPQQQWYTAQSDQQLRAQSQEFARTAYQRAAVHHHKLARQDDDPAAWRLALQHYDGFLEHWPAHEAATDMHHHAGEAAYRLGLHAVALDHFQVAAGAQTAGADTTTVVREAAWQVVAVSDAWYRDSQRGDTATAGPDSLARRLIDAVDWYQAGHSGAQHLPELMWRKGQVAYAHQWYAEAAGALSALGSQYPDDDHALQAVRMSGDAWYQLQDYLAAGAAYEKTLSLARQTRVDSVATAMEPIIPRCHYQHAQQVAAADSVQGPVTAAPLFAQVAAGWPTFEHADLALYRTGLGYEIGDDPAAATAAWERLLARYPESAYARDSALRIATSHEKSGQWQAAAAALDRFSAQFSADADAASALLKAVDLLAAAGDATGAEALKTVFLTRFPAEIQTVMDIHEERAIRALNELGDGRSPDDLAGLAVYLKLAAANPELASPPILAQVDYLQAEQAHARYTTLTLTQPLPAAITAKQKSLENLLAMYAACTNHGVAEYTRASAFRIGEAITHFGDALLASERPTELQGDDLQAYEEILEEQSWPFYDRGEAAWTDLLKQTAAAADDDPGQWLERTRHELWPRVAQRFVHMPEVEYPLVAAAAPQAKKPADEARKN